MIGNNDNSNISNNVANKNQSNDTNANTDNNNSNIANIDIESHKYIEVRLDHKNNYIIRELFR